MTDKSANTRLMNCDMTFALPKSVIATIYRRNKGSNVNRNG
jgi:hypothetical protein